MDSVLTTPPMQPEWALVIEAYRTLEIAAAASAPQAASPIEAAPVVEGVAPAESADEESLTGWVERVREIPGVEKAALSSVHGQLIAQGLLKCEVGHRSVGLLYRVTPQGKSALKTYQSAAPTPEFSEAA
jgi:hypothetical protein